MSTYLDHGKRYQYSRHLQAWWSKHRHLVPDTLTQHTSSNAALSVKGRAEMCCLSTASLGRLVASARPLLHMITSRLELTVMRMGLYVGTCWVGDKARVLTDERWSCTFPEQRLQRGWRDPVQIPRIMRDCLCVRESRQRNPVKTLRIMWNCRRGR